MKKQYRIDYKIIAVSYGYKTVEAVSASEAMYLADKNEEMIYDNIILTQQAITKVSFVKENKL